MPWPTTDGGEDELLDWLAGELPEDARRLLGDDAATLSLDGDWALTTDSQVEGVHTPVGFPPERLARRLLAVNLSDLAAMGARPRFALLALSARPGFDHRAFFTALRDAARRHRVLLAGGDLASAPNATVATLTLLGDLPRGRRWLRRDTARPGETLWVSGQIGGSALGLALLAAGGWAGRRTLRLPPAAARLPPPLRAAARAALRRHVLPSPRLDLGAWLARQPTGAAMDLSDGLARDLRRLCRRSGVGATIDLTVLPRPDGLAELCQHLEIEPTELAICGGEDYELLFTLPEGHRPPERFGTTPIGRVTEERLWLERTASGATQPLRSGGWDHLESIRRTAVGEPASISDRW